MKLFLKSLKYFGYFIATLIGIILLLLGLSYIKVNDSETVKDEKITIYLLTNGVHTDLAVPLKNAHFDWSKKISPKHTLAKDTTAKYVGMGWGDKGFYLETPTWADLKASTALKAASGWNSTAIHATFYSGLQENANCKKIQISAKNYLKMVAFISETFAEKEQNFQKIETTAVYGKNDVFYEAKGRYSLFYTCNTWANQALKAGNQKAALWTITDFGIFQHYE